jgi:hypothetical protein
VREPIRIGSIGRGEQPRVEHRVEPVECVVFAHLADGRHDIEVEVAVEDRRRSEELLRDLGKPDDAVVDDVEDGCGNGVHVERVIARRTIGRKLLEHLLDEERVAVGVGCNRLDQLRRHLRADYGSCEEGDVISAETAKWKALVVRLPRKRREDLGQDVPAGDLAVAVCANEEYLTIGDLSGDEAEERDRPSIGPVEVVEHDEQRALIR